MFSDVLNQKYRCFKSKIEYIPQHNADYVTKKAPSP